MKTPTLFQAAASAICMVAPMLLNAQPGIDSDNRPNRLDKIEAHRIAVITRTLDLSPAEAQKFWPVYNNFINEHDNMRKAFRKEMISLKKEPEQMKDEDFAKIIEHQFAFKQKMLDLKKEYYNKLKPVLPISKIARLYEAEKEIRKSMAVTKHISKDGRQKEPMPPDPPMPLPMPEDEED